MLAWTTTKIQGDNKPQLPKSLIKVESTFCEGYGKGFVRIVLKSFHKHLIGKTVRVDGRSKDFNQYFKLVNLS